MARTHLAIFRHWTLAGSLVAAAEFSVQTVMAALRRVAALLGLRTAAAVRCSGFVSRQGAPAGRLQKRWAAGVCVAAGGAAAAVAAAAGLCWFDSREKRSHSSSISGLLDSFPAVVEAKEKVGQGLSLLFFIHFILKLVAQESVADDVTLGSWNCRKLSQWGLFISRRLRCCSNCYCCCCCCTPPLSLSLTPLPDLLQGCFQ